MYLFSFGAIWYKVVYVCEKNREKNELWELNKEKEFRIQKEKLQWAKG